MPLLDDLEHTATCAVHDQVNVAIDVLLHQIRDEHHVLLVSCAVVGFHKPLDPANFKPCGTAFYELNYAGEVREKIRKPTR